MTKEEMLLTGLMLTAPERLLGALSRALSSELCAADTQKNCLPVIERAVKCVYKDETPPSAREREAAVARMEEAGIFAVTLLSADYPAALAAIPDPPPVLYGMGNRALLQRRTFCIVGSRILPAWAEKTGRTIAEALSKRFAVVTGFAEGGDRAAIDGAIASGSLICVLPTGVDIAYPAAHTALRREVAKRGLLLSEAAPGAKAQKFSFYARNRILAGLSEGVLVLAAGERSGTLITAHRALDYGREVFALPHNVGAAQGVGCNEMIKAGAWLCTSAKDVFAAFGMETEESPAAALSDREQRLLSVLRETGGQHIAVLAERAGIPVFEASAVLSSLEMKGLAVRAGGNRYSPV